MKRLTEDLKRALGALALSEAGELRPHWEKAALLDGRLPELPPAAAGAQVRNADASGTRRPDREIVLASEGQLGGTAIDYVSGLCRRLEAGLVLLVPKAHDERDRLTARQADRLTTDGTPWRIASLGDAGLAGVSRYVRDNPQVVLVVSAADNPLLHAIAGRRGRGQLRHDFPVPLVVLTQGTDQAA